MTRPEQPSVEEAAIVGLSQIAITMRHVAANIEGIDGDGYWGELSASLRHHAADLDDVASTLHDRDPVKPAARARRRVLTFGRQRLASVARLAGVVA